MVMNYAPLAGAQIAEAVEAACARARNGGERVILSFNGVKLNVWPLSRPGDIEALYDARIKLASATENVAEHPKSSRRRAAAKHK